MKSQLETVKQGILIELKDLGYSNQEMDKFQETTKCPRCGCDFTNLPVSGRWLAHLSNCKGK